MITLQEVYDKAVSAELTDPATEHSKPMAIADAFEALCEFEISDLSNDQARLLMDLSIFLGIAGFRGLSAKANDTREALVRAFPALVEANPDFDWRPTHLART